VARQRSVPRRPTPLFRRRSADAGRKVQPSTSSPTSRSDGTAGAAAASTSDRRIGRDDLGRGAIRFLATRPPRGSAACEPLSNYPEYRPSRKPVSWACHQRSRRESAAAPTAPCRKRPRRPGHLASRLATTDDQHPPRDQCLLVAIIVHVNLGQLCRQRLSSGGPVGTLIGTGRENHRIRMNVASRRGTREPISR
jgi:hypothetical protein